VTGSITTSSPAAILLKRVLGSGASTTFLVLSSRRAPAGSDCFRVRQALRQKGHEEQGQENHGGPSVSEPSRWPSGSGSTKQAKSQAKPLCVAS
jgi:hypothetical protein